MGEVRVGTSGWAYREWIPAFYPERTPASRMLSVYAERLSTVEAHNTYRRRPSPEALDKWAAVVPRDFRFAPKAHAAITHRRDLTDVETLVKDFVAGLQRLGDKLGPILFQLPHRDPDMDRLGRILDAIPSGTMAAFDLQPAWHTDEVIDRLHRAEATLVAVDDPGAVERMTPFTYVRLRKGEYRGGELAAWRQRLADAARTGDVYAFVKHDPSGVAPLTARKLT